MARKPGRYISVEKGPIAIMPARTSIRVLCRFRSSACSACIDAVDSAWDPLRSSCFSLDVECSAISFQALLPLPAGKRPVCPRQYLRSCAREQEGPASPFEVWKLLSHVSWPVNDKQQKPIGCYLKESKRLLLIVKEKIVCHFWPSSPSFYRSRVMVCKALTLAASLSIKNSLVQKNQDKVG